MSKFNLSRVACALTLSLGIATSALAQETSSGISGKVLDPTGAPVANAKVIIIHGPSGSLREITTNDSGSYNVRGLRVGGPYQVIVDTGQYQDQTVEDIYLDLGKPTRLSFNLERAQVETITVTGSRIVGGYTNSGSDGSWGADEVIQSSGGNRDLKDVLRSNPLAVVEPGSSAPMSIAGSNPRFNSFNVDGVSQNDDFGLNSNGYPTQRSPVSIDAVEQVTLAASPFTATLGGFSGGTVNVVTKSGGNDFFGSLFYEKSKDDWAGDPKDPETGEKQELDFDEDTYGFTLGGPIIKDKLFFFMSYDFFEGTPNIEWGPAGSGAPNSTQINLADYQAAREITERIYGVEPGVWDTSPEEEDEKILVKIDWDINADHRASFTYQDTTGNITRGLTSGERELKLDTAWYDYEQALETFSAHFYSTWTDNLSTEFKVAYKEVDSISSVKADNYGDVSVRTDSGDIRFGPDRSRHENYLETDTLNMRFVGEYLWDEHEITFGFDYEDIEILNAFVQDALGRWEFDSLEDYEAGLASLFTYQNAYTNNAPDAAADFSMATLALFLEDTLWITDEFKVVFGLRYERIDMDDEPTHNPNFEARYGFSNAANLDGLDLWLPRIGFEYEATENITIKGGMGRFGGGKPTVWISNSFNKDGLTLVQGDATLVEDDDGNFPNQDITRIPQAVLDSMVPGDGNTNIMDPNFELPTDWRYQLGMDYRFDIGEYEDWLWHVSYLFIDREDDVHWVDLARRPVGNTVGGRIIYESYDYLESADWNNENISDRYDLMMTNTDDTGESKIITTSLSKSFDSGVSFNFSYTNQDIENGNDGTSSTAESNFQYTPVISRNIPHVSTADYEIEHRLTLNLDYKAYFFKDYATIFSLFWERRSGKPYSYTLGAFRDRDLGDQSDFYSSNAYLPYIPTGADDPNVEYKNGLTYDEFATYLEAGELMGYAGGYSEKNSKTMPWVNRLDLNITQEFPGFTKEHKGTFYITIQNLLNLIDSDKGRVTTMSFSDTALVDYDINPDNNKYVYSPPFGGFNFKNWDTFETQDSVYNVKLGVRYRF